MKEKLKLGKEKLFSNIKSFNAKRNENTEKYSKLNFWLIALFPIFICSMAEINQGKSIASFLKFVVERPSVMLFNFVIAYLLNFILLSIFKKAWISTAIHGFAYMMLSTVELFKFGTNGNHLILSDMKLFKSVKSLTSFAYIKITFPLVLAWLIAIAAFVVIFWFNPKLKMKPFKRILTMSACCMPCVSLITMPSFSTPVYSLFNVDTTKASNTFILNEKFESNSFLAFIVETATESFSNRLTEPEDYSEEKVEEILSVDLNENENFNGGVKPNVVVIMSEAYADFRVFDELDIDENCYAEFDKAVSEGIGGTAISPTYASFTVRSEFELLFGLPVRSLNDPNMPQRDLAEREQPALAQYYKNWGYNTAYVHPFYENFYSRRKVYSRFGFDTMIFENDFTVPVENFGTYISDTTVFNQLESLINESDEPMYIHTTTMQNHQPYDQGENPDAEFENYCQWIQHTNEELAKFLDRLEQSDEPTLVLFVGDHFPSLKGGSGIYDQLGINGENCSVLYEQKYLLWSNYDADFAEFPQNNVSLYYMPYVLMNVIDAPRDSFIQKMFDYMETLPVYSTNYNDSIPRNEELDILTYDRVIGEVMSPCPIPEDVLAEEVK
ncbi:MAG: sulfatase-like hydrolase/transferase [Ruminococcus sp.]|nr:sulfatase-like hydrolase/transferase [Ruminococcus sp.]